MVCNGNFLAGDALCKIFFSIFCGEYSSFLHVFLCRSPFLIKAGL